MKDQLEQYIHNRKVDIVMSDIAPNFSGDHNIDHLKQVGIPSVLFSRLICVKMLSNLPIK